MKPSLTKNSMFNVAYQLVLVLVPLISSMYVSRVVLPDALGEVSVANNLVSYFVALAPLGIPAYGVREIAKAGDDKRVRSALFSELLIINFVSTVVFFVAYGVCVVIMYGTAVPELYLIFGSLIVANALNVEWFFQGMERYDFISIRGTIVRIACLLLTILLVKSPSDVFVYAAITCLGTFANYIVNVLCLRKSVEFTTKGLSFSRHLRPITVLAGTNVLFSLYTKIDVTMMGVLCASSIIAYYTYAYNAEEIAKTLCVAITNVYLPRLSYEFKNDTKEFSRLVQQSMDLNIFIALPMCLGVFILAPKVVVILFGDAFVPASLTLRLFAVLIVAKSIGNVIYQTTIATGNERFQLIAYTLGVVVNIALNAALIPVFAQNGAVIATVVTEVALDLVLWACLRNYMRFRFTFRFVISTLISLGAMCAVVVACDVFITSRLLCILVAVVLAVVVYASVSVLLKNEVALMFARKLLRN